MSATSEVKGPPAERLSPQPEDSIWRQLLIAAAIANILAFAAIAVLLGDLEAGAYAVGFAVGLALLRLRRGRLGIVALLLLSANVLGWMSLGVVSNLRNGEGVVAVAIPALLTALSIGAAVAAIADLARRSRPGGSRAAVRGVALAAAVLFAGLVVASAVTSSDAPAAAEGDLTVVSNNVLFEPEELAASAGEITVHMTNRDLFWHTFTIDELDVDLRVAVNGQRAATFDAPAGTYLYYCRIPGHETRMRGTLVVRD
jgi:plastocyanin